MKGQVVFPIITKEAEVIPFLITGVALYYEENGVNRIEGIPDYQWSYCEEGEGCFEYNNQQYLIKKGMAFFFRKDLPHRYYPIKGLWKVHWVTFKGKGVEGVLNYMHLGEVEFVEVLRDKTMQHLLEDMLYILKSTNHEYEKSLLASQKLYQLLIEMGTNKKNVQEKERYKGYERLQPVVTYMQENYSRVITLEELSVQIKVTPYYLCRVFKKTYQMKPMEYLNQIRIQKAKVYLMQDNTLKSKDIARLVGFQDKSYFAMKFRMYEGCSPIEFRSQYRTIHPSSHPQYNRHQ